MATSNRPWLDRLKHHLTATAVSGYTPETPTAPTDKTDKTQTIDGFVGFVGASGRDQEQEIAWRMAAFRAAIPSHGPIWPPRLRNTPLCDTPGHCALCGDELAGDPVPRFRCSACVRALWLALHTDREGVPA